MGRKHKEHHEEHADETWLVPYADLLTLLLALFIVLFAMGKTDQKKFEEVGRSFNVAFGGGAPAFFEFNQTPPQVSPLDVPPPPVQQFNVTVLGAPVTGPTQQSLRETVQLIQLKEALDKYIREKGLGGEIDTTLSEEGLRIRIREAALFRSGESELLPEARKLASEMAKLLVGLTQQIVISGHTDNVPINTARFPTNWELSSSRSVNFMRFLFYESPALKPAQFSAVGYGEYRPVGPNTTPEGRAQNRRVEVWVLRSKQQPQ